MTQCPLSQIEIGEKCIIKDILTAEETAHRLKELGFCNDAIIKVLSKDFICEVCQTRFGFSKHLADKIMVEKCS